MSTRVVSWNDAAEMNERFCGLAFVIPCGTGCRRGLEAERCRFRVHFEQLFAVDDLAEEGWSSPGFMISTFCSIWRDHSSICLSLIVAPARRYTA